MDPTSRAIALINALNDPRQVVNATSLSNQLQDLQLSSDGWTVADNLLNSTEPTLQFFGALTFQIKLNRDAATLSQEDAKSILSRMLANFANCVRRSTSARIIDKLCSMLATFLVQSSYSWNNALGDVATCLCGGSLDLEQIPDEHTKQAQQSIDQLNTEQVQLLFKFARILTEDLGKFEGNTLRNLQVEQSMRSNVPIFVSLVTRMLTGAGTAKFSLLKEIFASYSTWSIYATNHWQYEYDTMVQLQGLTNHVIKCLTNEQFPVVFEAAEALASILEESPKFMSPLQLNDLEVALHHTQRSSVELSTDETMPLIKLLTRWARVIIPIFMEHPERQSYRELMTQLTKALGEIDWAEDGCEQLFLITDFWSEFAYEISDADSDGLDEEQQMQYRSIMNPVMAAYLQILDRKDEQTMAETDPDFIEDWKSICASFTELLSNFVPIACFQVYLQCAQNLDNATAEGNLFRIESVLQILNGLVVSYEPSTSTTGLTHIFKSDGFRLLLESTTSDKMSNRLKSIIVRFLDDYSFYFKEDAAQIPSLMLMLMQLLEQNISADSRLADSSAKAFASICSQCRAVLVNQLGDLLDFCKRALNMPGLSTFQKEKIYSGMAYVIESLTDQKLQIDSLTVLMEQLYGELANNASSIRQGDKLQGEEPIAMNLQCLAGFIKAFHSRDQPIVVDVEDDNNTRRDIWTTDEGRKVALRLVDCIKFVEVVPLDGDAWDSICSILRISLSETQPGPFTLPSEFISRFLQTMKMTSPRAETLISTACTFISAKSRRDTPREVGNVTGLYEAVFGILSELQNPNTDPELAQLCTEFFEQLIPRYSDVLLGSAPDRLSYLIDFQLKSLTGTAPMLKRISASFTSALLLLPTSISKGEITLSEDIPDLQNHIKQYIDAILPLFVSAVTHQVCGNAQRSELDAIAKVMRSCIVATGPLAKSLFEQSLTNFTSPNITDTDKRNFIQKILMLRGGKGSTDVIKEFWAKCKGTISSF